jgi:hypothetical protein
MVSMKRGVVAIGSTDAHARRLLPDCSWSGHPGYAGMFKIVQTIIISDSPFTGEYGHDRRIVMNALREGHCYVGFPCFGDVKGFRFTASSGGRTAGCGDSLYVDDHSRLKVVLPDSVSITIRIVRNGCVIHTAKNLGNLDMDITQPGVYRVEVFQDRTHLPFLQKRCFPWILSNPIYIARAGTPALEVAIGLTGNEE